MDDFFGDDVDEETADEESETTKVAGVMDEAAPAPIEPQADKLEAAQHVDTPARGPDSDHYSESVSVSTSCDADDTLGWTEDPASFSASAPDANAAMSCSKQAAAPIKMDAEPMYPEDSLLNFHNQDVVGFGDMEDIGLWA